MATLDMTAQDYGVLKVGTSEDDTILFDQRYVYLIQHVVSVAQPVFFNLTGGTVEATDGTAADKAVLHNSALGATRLLVWNRTAVTCKATGAASAIMVQRLPLGLAA